MTDEPKAGQSPEDNASADAPQDATQTDSAQTDVDDGLPERFRGKSASEIAQSYAELERKMSEQGSELGDLRNQMAFMQAQNQPQAPAMPQYQNQPAPQQWGQQQPDTNYDDRFLESPFKATLGMMQSYDQYQSARLFPMAMKMAQDARPDLFDTPDTVNQVQQTIRQGVQSGMFRPDVQSDPTSISAIALYLKDQQRQQSPAPRTPVQPVATEAPPQVKKTEPVKRQVEFSDRGEQDFLKHIRTLDDFKDFSDEDAAEMVREAEQERNKR